LKFLFLETRSTSLLKTTLAEPISRNVTFKLEYVTFIIFCKKQKI